MGTDVESGDGAAEDGGACVAWGNARRAGLGANPGAGRRFRLGTRHVGRPGGAGAGVRRRRGRGTGKQRREKIDGVGGKTVNKAKFKISFCKLNFSPLWWPQMKKF